jgi:hypothetical protein
VTDPGMTQALMALLPTELRAAVDGGADPGDLAQTLLMQRLQQPSDDEPESVDADEEPWPEVGWENRARSAFDDVAAEETLEPQLASSAMPDPRLIELARALGACPLCFGDAPDCPVCAGAGAPGWAVPEPSLFSVFVLPALQRLQSEELHHAQGAAGRHSTRPPQGSNGHSAST